MKLIRMFGLTTLAATVFMAVSGLTSASATNTQYCVTQADGLTCAQAAGINHWVLDTGTVGKVLGSLVDILCLNILMESLGADVGALGSPQRLDATSMSFTGCGTTSAHSNCTVTVEELPDNTLLKLGLDEGSLEVLSGRIRLQGCGLGLNCPYDLEGLLFSAGANHMTANETAITELGGLFFCPKESQLDFLMETLGNRFVLQ